MTLVSGLITRSKFERLTDLAHTKHYRAQARNRSDQHMYGYDIIKLDQDVTWCAGLRDEKLTEFTANKGEYLVKCHGQPPRRIKNWTQLKQEFHVFRNSKTKTESE